jgi:hypothetical protein
MLATNSTTIIPAYLEMDRNDRTLPDLTSDYQVYGLYGKVIYANSTHDPNKSWSIWVDNYKHLQDLENSLYKIVMPPLQGHIGQINIR